MTTRRLRTQWPVILVSAAVACAIVIAGTFVFVRSREAMEDQIRSRLSSTAAAAALHFDGEAIDMIRSASDVGSPDYNEVVRRLDQLRGIEGIRFAYILRRTDDANILAFVADADAARSPVELDDNANGVIESDEEPGYPGDLYDISEIPALQHDAFGAPTADDEITYDQWGALISGYAPIRRDDGSVAAVLGVDMDAAEFSRLSESVFSPGALVLLFIAALAASIVIGFAWERRQVAVLSRINSERSGLLRLTFHQLGEPLTIMKWSLETLRDEANSPEIKKLVQDHIVCMDEGLGRLNSIIDTLQLAEKVDLNTLEYLPVPGSLKELVDNAVNEWSSSLHKRKQRVHVFMDEDVTLPLDKTLLMLVFRQVLVNAIEYSDDGSEISIRVSKGRNGVEIAVQDEGCGIPPSDMVHLFEKYRRAGNAHLKKPDGNGLGLYIARGVIERAGGRMWVESELGKGTVVYFTLPITA